MNILKQQGVVVEVALGFYIKEPQVEIWTLSLNTSITLGKLHAPSEPQFTRFYNGENNSYIFKSGD